MDLRSQNSVGLNFEADGDAIMMIPRKIDIRGFSTAILAWFLSMFHRKKREPNSSKSRRRSKKRRHLQIRRDDWMGKNLRNPLREDPKCWQDICCSGTWTQDDPGTIGLLCLKVVLLSNPPKDLVVVSTSKRGPFNCFVICALQT